MGLVKFKKFLSNGRLVDKGRLIKKEDVVKLLKYYNELKLKNKVDIDAFSVNFASLLKNREIATSLYDYLIRLNRSKQELKTAFSYNNKKDLELRFD